MKKAFRTLPLLALFLLGLRPFGNALAAPYQPLVGIVHLHSTASTGVFSLEEIVLRAEALGIDVILLAENYHLQFTYGPPPLPELFRVSKSFKSLTRTTIAEHVKRVEETNRRHPRVILIPGVETVPHYFWTGSPWSHDLTMHDSQKNILVTGLSRAEDYRSLPIIGNPAAARYDKRSLIRAAPLLLVIAGFGLMAVKRERHIRVGGFRISQRRRPWSAAVSLLLIGGAWSAYNAPFTVPTFPTAGPEAGTAPHQALIDYVNRLGGATIWSYPEAKDYHVYPFPLLPRAGRFVARTDPHPEVLLATQSYTAFGAVYQDTTRAERPGRTWDRALEQYCLGGRERPPWGLGELGFHGADRKGLADVLTTFYVQERTAEGVLGALSAGRMYAVIPERRIRLKLGGFALTKGEREAVMGETLEVRAGEAVTLRLALEAHDGASHPFQAVLVRNGKAWKNLEGSTPFSLTIEDVPSPKRRCTYYRLWMRRPHRLITNPLFAASLREIRD